MTLQAGRIYGGVGRLGAARQGGATATPWWLSGGISAANCIAAYQPKGAADLAASYVNLANPGTYTCAEGAAVTWNATDGWVGNNSGYLKTGIMPGYQWTTIIRYAVGNAQLQDALFGCTPLYMIRRGGGAGNIEYYCGGNGSASTALPGVSGTYGIRNVDGYKDGLFDNPIALAGTSDTNTELYILAWNNNGTTAGQSEFKVQAFATYNAILTETQYLAVHTAMAAL